MATSRSLLRHASRLLQQHGHDDEDHGDEHGDEHAGEEDTLDLRIAAVFVILTAGLLGGLVALMFKCFRNPAHPATLILRALSAGVILSLAIIHVVPHGMEDLGELHEYNFGALAVVFGVLMMVWTESLTRTFLSKNMGAADAQETEMSISNVPEPSKDAVPEVDAVRSSANHGHTCLAVNTAANLAANPQSSTIRHQVIAYMFELACVVHSFLIGLALGVTTNDRKEAIALFAALVFHQGLEGIGLGSAIVRAQFTLWKGLVMICTYALMTPLGVAIGIGIADSYEHHSTTSMAIQGTLNSVSGGLLLYISLVQLIAEDFTRADLQQAGVWGQVGMHVALMVGAGAMAVIGIWN